MAIPVSRQNMQSTATDPRSNKLIWKPWKLRVASECLWTRYNWHSHSYHHNNCWIYSISWVLAIFSAIFSSKIISHWIVSDNLFFYDALLLLKLTLTFILCFEAGFQNSARYLQFLSVLGIIEEQVITHCSTYWF